MSVVRPGPARRTMPRGQDDREHWKRRGVAIAFYGNMVSPAALEASLWSDTATSRLEVPTLHGAIDTDTVIVGAGYTGLSTALHLAERGVDTVVLEAEQPGFGASGRNGGQVIAGLRHFRSTLVDAYGAAAGSMAFDFGAATASATFDLITRHAIDCDARETGWIQAAETPTEMIESQHRVRGLQAEGAPVRLLERDEVQWLTGSTHYVGGWIDARGGTVQPLSYARGLARAATRNGARIFADSRAIAVERDGATWRVVTAAGSVRARRLLLATNALTDRLWPRLRRMILPVWSFQIATAPLSASLGILRGEQAVSDTRRILSYFRVDRDGRLVMGGKGTAIAPTGAGDFATQRRNLRRLYPHLADVPITHCWGGEVAITIDRLPRLVELGPNALASFGCNGKGIAWCSSLGARLAAHLIDGETLPLPITRLRPIPFQGLRRVYVGVGSAWLRFRDAIGR